MSENRRSVQAFILEDTQPIFELCAESELTKQHRDSPVTEIEYRALCPALEESGSKIRI